MYKLLTALAVVALAALGTTIIATVLLHSSISKQSGEIKRAGKCRAFRPPEDSHARGRGELGDQT